jgi:hypothetical protein
MNPVIHVKSSRVDLDAHTPISDAPFVDRLVLSASVKFAEPSEKLLQETRRYRRNGWYEYADSLGQLQTIPQFKETHAPHNGK